MSKPSEQADHSIESQLGISDQMSQKLDRYFRLRCAFYHLWILELSLKLFFSRPFPALSRQVSGALVPCVCDIVPSLATESNKPNQSWTPDDSDVDTMPYEPHPAYILGTYG